MRLAILLTLKGKIIKTSPPKDNVFACYQPKVYKTQKLLHFLPYLFRYWLRIDTDNYLKLKSPLEITQLSVDKDHDLDHDLQIIFSG